MASALELVVMLAKVSPVPPALKLFTAKRVNGVVLPTMQKIYVNDRQLILTNYNLRPYYADGAIKIRLRHATTGRPLKYSSLVNTLCHELAHLRHFNHGPRFRAFYFEILDHARAMGIYRPGEAQISAPAQPPAPQRRATAPGPEQLSLFG